MNRIITGCGSIGLTIFFLLGIAVTAESNEATLRLTGPDGGLVLGTATPASYVKIPGGMEVTAEVDNKKDTVYLYLDVKAPGFADGAAPIVQFSFEYFDESVEELTFEIDSSDPLYGSPSSPGKWRDAGGLQFMDSGTWKTKTIVLKDTLFSKRLNGSDIRFKLKGTPRLRLRNVFLKKLDQEPALPPSTRTQKDSPNILMVVFDDLNDYLGPYEDPNAKTPSLDTFAKSALHFDRAYCQYPVCGPSRASFMSGLYPETSGVLNNSQHIRGLRPDAINLLEYFKNKGYWTASAGKIFHGHQNVAETQVSTYAADWFENAEDPWKKKLERQFVKEVGPIKKNQDAYKAFMKEKFISPQRVVQAIATDLRDEDHRDGRTATRTTSYLKEKPYGDRPFFIACGFSKPHVPLFAPKKYFDLYPLDQLQFEDVPADDWKDKPQAAMYNKYKGYGAEFGKNDRALRAKWLQAYLACVSFSDSQFGRVMKALEESGQADNTIVIVFGDHGYHIGEHYLYGKVTLFEESARVPFMMRVPGTTRPGTATQSFAELIDVYPTLTDLCGLKTPPHVQGKSLVPILTNPQEEVRDSVYTVVRRPGMVAQSIRHQNWRYAEWGNPDAAELYDLKKDPNEYHNLAGNPEYKKVVQSLSKRIKEKRSDLTKQK